MSLEAVLALALAGLGVALLIYVRRHLPAAIEQLLRDLRD